MPPNCDGAVERLLDFSREYATQNGIRDCKIDFKYVTGFLRALVFDVTIIGASGEMNYFAKVGADLSDEVRAYVENEANLTMSVHKRFPDSVRFGTVKLMSYCPDRAVFITQSIHGKRLDHELIAALRWPTQRRIQRAYQLLENCAGWLTAFQNSWPQDGHLDTTSLLAGFKRRLVRLSIVRPKLVSPDLAEWIIDVATQIAGTLDKNVYRIVMRHDDFAPWNMIAHGDQVFVYDFADAQPGSMYYDKYYFDHALSTLGNKPFVNKRLLDRFRHRFYDSFDGPANHPIAEQRLFSIYFSSARLGSLVFMRQRKFPLNLIIKIRMKQELKRLVSLCKD